MASFPTATGRPRPAGDGAIGGWDVADGRRLRGPQGPDGLVYGVAFSAAGKRLFSPAGNTMQPGEIKVWDVRSPEGRLTLRSHRGFLEGLAISPIAER